MHLPKVEQQAHGDLYFASPSLVDAGNSSGCRATHSPHFWKKLSDFSCDLMGGGGLADIWDVRGDGAIIEDDVEDDDLGRAAFDKTFRNEGGSEGSDS